MTIIEDYYRQLLSGPLKYTTARWFNDFSESVQGPGGEWIVKPQKKPAYRGKYTQFRYGCDHQSTWRIKHLQRCLVCCSGSHVIGVDVDHPELFATTRTARFIGRAQAISTRGAGYHVLLDCREIPDIVWPRQTPVAGADIKSAGFIPVPGSVHYSGQLYQPVPGAVAVAVPLRGGLIGAIVADQQREKARRKAETDRFLASHGLPPLPAGYGGGGGHDGQVAAACMGMILRKLRAGWQIGPKLKEAVYAEWLKIAIPRNPAWPFERVHFERHYGNERRGGLEAALAIIADEATWMPGAMAMAEDLNRQARALPRRHRDDPEQIRRAYEREGEDAVSEMPEGFSAEITSADQITPRRARWLMDTPQLKIPLGELTIFAGREGAAKSQFTIWLIAHITRGTLPGELHGKPRNVIICAREDSWEHTIVPRLMAANADLSRVKRVKVRNAATAKSYDLVLPLDNEVLRKTIIELDAALVVFDPLLSVLDGDLNTHRASDVRSALEPLADIAHETGCPMGGLAHFAKTEGRDAASLISGSHAFKDVARAVVVFARDTEDTGIVSQVKNNLGKLPVQSKTYTIQTVQVNIDEGTPEQPWTVQAEVPRFVPGSVTARHVEDLLDQGKAREVARARDFLRRELADGQWHLAKDVTDAAGQEDISERTLKRARMALGIVPRKDEDRWWMSLPTTTTTGTLGTVGSLGIVGTLGTLPGQDGSGPSGPRVPTVPAIPRVRVREDGKWWLTKDGAYDWQAMHDMASFDE